MCPSGCGTLTRVADGHAVKLEGSPMHPINLGALCPKGQAAPELLYNPDRLTGPLRQAGERGQGQWKSISWDEAVDVAAAKLGVYLTQGVYEMPCYDLENSNYILAFGASLLEAGPVPQRVVSGFSFLRQGRSTRGKVVVIDPRQGVSGAKADEWIPIVPGTDAALALGIANVIIQSGLIDTTFINNYCFGFEDFADEPGENLISGFKTFVLENFAPERAAEITGVAFHNHRSPGRGIR